jgi:hypothetical protein
MFIGILIDWLYYILLIHKVNNKIYFLQEFYGLSSFQIVQQIYQIPNHYLGFLLIIVVYMMFFVKQYIQIKVHYYFICYYIEINILKLMLYLEQILIKLYVYFLYENLIVLFVIKGITSSSSHLCCY